MVEDLVQTYRVNMNLTVCFESNGPCMIIAPVLTNTILPKPVCNWKTGFIDPRRFYITDTTVINVSLKQSDMVVDENEKKNLAHFIKVKAYHTIGDPEGTVPLRS